MRFSIEIAERIFHVTQTRTRAYIIESPANWLGFADTCRTLGCTNCEIIGRVAINGQKQSFRQWMSAKEVTNDQSYFMFDEQIFRSDFLYCL
jgi:hypothetical protein